MTMGTRRATASKAARRPEAVRAGEGDAGHVDVGRARGEAVVHGVDARALALLGVVILYTVYLEYNTQRVLEEQRAAEAKRR